MLLDESLFNVVFLTILLINLVLSISLAPCFSNGPFFFSFKFSLNGDGVSDLFALAAKKITERFFICIIHF